jgi:hypothetical protein
MAAGEDYRGERAGMRVLLVHPEDDPPSNLSSWDLVIDLGRAPCGWYKNWKKSTGCDVVSVYDFAEEIGDLYCIRDQLQQGSGRLVDSAGVDWWNIVSLEIVPDLLRLLPLQRLSCHLSRICELHTTCRDVLSDAVAHLCNARLTTGNAALSWRRKIAHRAQRIFNLDGHQSLQVLEDKLGLNGVWNSNRHRHYSGGPVILLPTAYSNSSRTALNFASQLPERKFLLVYTRMSGAVADLPENVVAEPLAVSLRFQDSELTGLISRWQGLQKHLSKRHEVWQVAKAVGILDKVPSLLRWGLSYRNAWQKIFATHDVAACLSTDDSNPPTRIPLDLAHAVGVPSVACHHGALDYFMAFKTVPVDAYIAKSELERDYMLRVCHLPEEKIICGTKRKPDSRCTSGVNRDQPWLVFFSEPYSTWFWRSNAIYSELLPRLHQLAKKLELQLVLKIHPFESVREHRGRLKHLLPLKTDEITLIPGPCTSELWKKTRLAVTVQSTTALQCAELGVPVFLCGWLRDPHSGYQGQLARFSIGELLNSVEEIDEIPARLNKSPIRGKCSPVWTPLSALELDALLSGSHTEIGEQVAVPYR